MHGKTLAALRLGKNRLGVPDFLVGQEPLGPTFKAKIGAGTTFPIWLAFGPGGWWGILWHADVLWPRKIGQGLGLHSTGRRRLCRRGPIAGLVGELDRGSRVEPVRLLAQRQGALRPVCSAFAAR